MFRKNQCILLHLFLITSFSSLNQHQKRNICFKKTVMIQNIIYHDAAHWSFSLEHYQSGYYLQTHLSDTWSTTAFLSWRRRSRVLRHMWSKARSKPSLCSLVPIYSKQQLFSVQTVWTEPQAVISISCVNNTASNFCNVPLFSVHLYVKIISS